MSGSKASILGRRWLSILCVALLLVAASAGAIEAKKNKKPRPPRPAATFGLVASDPGTCLANARGTGRIFRQGPVERLELSVTGLPRNKEFDVFIIQQPDPPFGLSWYQGDLETDKTGKGTQSYVGRFNIETFIVAPGAVPAPVVHGGGEFPDADTNPQTAPVHTFHVGVWFNSPSDAQAAGCLGTVTPFNGDHNAGVQVLKTQNDANGRGPLAKLGS